MDLQDVIRHKAAVKEEVRCDKKKCRDAKYMMQCRLENCVQRDAKFSLQPEQVQEPFCISESAGQFLSLPTEVERQEHISAFIDATGNEAVSCTVCVVCARERL